MLDFLNLRPNAFGLDISDLSLKVVQLKERGGILRLRSFGEYPIKKGIIREGEIKKEKELSETIKEALRKVRPHHLSTRYVIASLPEEKAFLQVIQMPKIPESDLKSAVLYEAENYIPLPVEDVYFDSQIVRPVVDSLDHIDVLIAALPRKIVDSYLNSITAAGLVPLAFEIESLSVARALIKQEISPFPQLLLDLGATRTSFIVFSGYALRFTASIPVSSDKFTEAIAKTLRIDINKAEEMKIEHGLQKKEIFDALVPSLTDLVEQIKRYLDYYQTHSSHEHLASNSKGVENIVLCGGGANLKGLKDFISLECRLPVSLGNPWVNIITTPLKEIPLISYSESLRYTTALGLALRGLRQ